MNTCRTRIATFATLSALVLAGCGPQGGGGDASGGTVALQAAEDTRVGNGADGADATSSGGDGEDGADGTSRGGAGDDRGEVSLSEDLDPAVGEAPKRLRACLTRNDEVVPWSDDGVTKSTGWHRQHRQDAHVRIKNAVDKRLGVSEDGLAAVQAGFLGYALDPIGSRLIMQLDPDLIDIDEFRDWVRGVARKANQAADVKGSKLTVTVQAGCFSAREVAALIRFPRETTHRSGMTSMISNVQLDGRIHAAFADAPGAIALQKRFGPVLAAHYPGGPTYRFHL
jgi:hypothetical protein